MKKIARGARKLEEKLFLATGYSVNMLKSRVTLTCYVNSSFINGDVVLCPRDMLSNNELPNKRRERQSEALITAISSSHEDPEPVEHVQSVTRGIGNETVQKIASLLLKKSHRKYQRSFMD